MNTCDLDIMNTIVQCGTINQREVSDLSGYSLGRVNQAIKNMFEQGLIDSENKITNKMKKIVEERKPQRAVILAAGYGLRMAPINMDIPKALIEINKENLIERQIRQLNEAGINEIYVVVGFMKEQFEYLIDKYDVRLIVNETYTTKNNLYSLHKVLDKLNNCYIVPCDIWIEKNPFNKIELYSWYMVTNKRDFHGDVYVNRKKEIVKGTGKQCNQLVGIAYILPETAEILKLNIEKMIKDKKYDNSFWEEAAFVDNKMILTARIEEANKVFEINTYEQLRKIDAESKQLQSPIIALIASVLNVGVNEIINIEIMKKGMTNRSFIFECRDKRYIMRVPGEGTEVLVNRKHEYDVYNAIKNMDICDRIYYINPENGYKISDFLENVHVCDSRNEKDVRLCMEKLKAFHNKKIAVKHTFDLFEQIEFYEKLRGETKSLYNDYELTKQKIYELKEYIDKQPKIWTLTHIDAVPDNFLFKGDKIYLIDWEYAGMQDAHVDIAMFAIYSLYDKDEIDKLIDYYFSFECDLAVRLKIYCYIAVCGLLWSNWCEYKRLKGVEFGEYSLRQYRYAKDFYKYFKSEISKLV